jgi:hypothetical protein
MLGDELKRVAAVELKRIARLRVDINSDDIEPGAVISHRRSTLAAKEIKQSRPSHAAPSLVSIGR